MPVSASGKRETKQCMNVMRWKAGRAPSCIVVLVAFTVILGRRLITAMLVKKVEIKNFIPAG